VWEGRNGHAMVVTGRERDGHGHWIKTDFALLGFSEHLFGINKTFFYYNENKKKD